MFYRKLYLVVFVVLTSVLAALSLTIPAHAETIKSYEVINNYTIKQTYTPTGAPTYAEQTRYLIATEVPSNPGQNSGAEFKPRSTPSGYCDYKITLDVNSNYVLTYKRKSGSACDAQASTTRISPDNKGALEYYFYQADSSTIKSLSPGKSNHSFKIVPRGEMPGGSPGEAYVENGASDKCPAMLLKNGSTWGFFDAEDTGDIQDNEDSVFYQAIAKAAGYSDTAGCNAESGGAREASEASLARVLGKDASYYDSARYWFEQTSWGKLNNPINDRVKNLKGGVGPKEAAVAIDEVTSGADGDTATIDADTQEECSEADGSWNEETGECEVENTSTCQVESGLGWIICPVMNTVADINDEAFNFIKTFLETPPLINQEGVPLSENGIYKIWAMVRNVANVFFVIAFLAIIYSQITSIGISNYGIKKMLPKLIVGAVLINTSFWLTGIAIDASNVIGRSIYNVLQYVAETSAGSDALPGTGDHNWGSVTAMILGGTVVAVAAGLAGLLPIILGGFFVIVGLIFTLTFRQAMIFVLIAAAPLAIASYLLPNTDGFFKAWWKFLKVLLYLYPVIAFIMGVSTVAAAVTFEVAETATDGLTRIVMMLIALGMPAMGIAAGLMLARTMGSLLGKFGVTNPLSGFTNAAKDRAKSFGTRADKNIGASSMRGGKFRRKVIGGTLGRIGGHRGKALRSIREKTVDDKFQGAALNTDEGRDVLMRSDVAKSRLATTQAEAKAEFEKRKAANDPMDSLGAEAATNAEREYIAQVSASNSSQITKESIADNLRDSPDLQAQAAGADINFGTTRARASAKQALEQLAEERIKTERSDMSRYSGDKLMDEIRNANNSTERKAAALELIGTAGEDKHVRAAMDHIGSLTSPDAQDLQQQFYKGNASRINAIASQQDKNALALGAFGAAAGPGAPPRTYEDVLFKRVNDGSMSGERMASLTKTQLQDMYEVIATRGTTMDPDVLTKLETSIDKFRTNKTINQPESKITDEMDKIKTLL